MNKIKAENTHCVCILLCLRWKHCSHTLPVQSMTCHSFCAPTARSYVTAQVCIQKRASRYSRFILVVGVKDSFFFDSAERELFLHNARQAFCFAVYCQCAPLIKKHVWVFLKEIIYQSKAPVSYVLSPVPKLAGFQQSTISACTAIQRLQLLEALASHVSKGLYFAEANFIYSLAS